MLRGGRSFGQRGPLAARAQDIHQPVDDLAHVHRPLVAAPLGRRDQRPDQRPFLDRSGRSGSAACCGRTEPRFSFVHIGRLLRIGPATMESQVILNDFKLFPDGH